MLKSWATLRPAAAVSLGPVPLTAGAAPVAHACATAPPLAPPLAAVLLAGALDIEAEGELALVLVLVLGLELLLQAAATSIRPATTPVTSTGWRR
ncbi:hypothetical protein [Streptacidiphilus sp. MAP12-33]|uniref:hypothetical protein n=1 Tax=Streptacidiphilus sp. MAP12-33 TaxID=3156266 RepID=UPI003519283B